MCVRVCISHCPWLHDGPCFIGRLGEVTLRDFKAAVDREGSFRYHFKALDPEFGTVKEEVGVRAWALVCTRSDYLSSYLTETVIKECVAGVHINRK